MNISRFNEIKSMFVSYDSDHLSRAALNFSESLEMENKLHLLSFIQNKIDVYEPSQFLIHVTFSTKIKENWKIIATGITIFFQISLYLVNHFISQQPNSTP